MISLVYSESRLCMASIVFYTSITIPLLQLTKNADDDQSSIEELAPYLSVSKFEELEETEEGMCSICLIEFQKDDAVSRLCRCGHVFHMDCMERWLDCCQFTCPLCRAFVLMNVKSSQPNKCHFH
ncbi:hypothetical protein Pint_33971 [Pistacia integerrima]|uniref:Uncharacterized protein n=1 Tax=Pistacia integerrima TaxID=434235 RepID=A0ACC0X723_9ROSI|nr:hypothetical protein Pint_33971 [Pistacia integerrima]KAJ0077225.1 hypothetical protein Patl1_35572 [Pistacia atlantica]